MILFPALASFPDGSQHSAVKVYNTPSGCDVWEWNPDLQRAEIIASGTCLHEEERHVYVTDVPETGRVRVVADPTDCGCSHPLKYFRPAAPVRA